MAAIRALFIINFTLAVFFGTFALYDLYYFYTPTQNDKHSGLLALYSSATLVTVSALFLLTSIALSKNWKIKWVLQALTITIFAFFITM